jgi:hypothetical protein
MCVPHSNSKEDIEEMKKTDMLDALLKEFGASFPEFKRVLIDERDMYLANSLRNAYQPLPNEFVPGGNFKRKNKDIKNKIFVCVFFSTLI